MKTVIFLILTLALAPSVFADPVWIDVRSVEEHQQDHIEGDLRVSHDQITPAVKRLFPDKNQEINLYCRSGRRAEISLQMLNVAGYSNVYNRGGINDAREARQAISAP